jgi:hypothetical protein
VRLVVVLGHAASMADRHVGKLVDVWKHLVLAEAGHIRLLPPA